MQAHYAHAQKRKEKEKGRVYHPGTKRRGGEDGVEEEVGVEKGWERGGGKEEGGSGG